MRGLKSEIRRLLEEFAPAPETPCGVLIVHKDGFECGGRYYARLEDVPPMPPGYGFMVVPATEPDIEKWSAEAMAAIEQSNEEIEALVGPEEPEQEKGER